MEPELGAAPTGVIELQQLPDELIARVLARLPSTRDLGRAHCVCHAWHADGSPVEQALRLRLEASGSAVPAVPPGTASAVQRLCLYELFRAARDMSGVVAAREELSAAIDSQGQLRVWGCLVAYMQHTDDPDVILGEATPTVLPVRQGARVTGVSVGFKHLLALTDAGEVFSLGDGLGGMLGHGDEENQHELKVIEALRGVRITAISAGGGHSLALTDEGAVLSFGDGDCGPLGHGNEEDQPAPKVIEALRGSRVVAVSAGHTPYSLVLTDEGTVLSFGFGEYGCLGHGDREDQYEPKVIEALRGVRVVAIAAGHYCSYVLTDEGTVLSFGRGLCGGHGDVNEIHLEPKVIEALSDVRVVAIAAGYEHSMVLTDEGKVLSFGSGGYGELGHGDRATQCTPKVIEMLRSMRVVAIAAGANFSLVLTDVGAMFSFGHALRGSLGQGERGIPEKLSGDLLNPDLIQFVQFQKHAPSHS